MICLVDKPVLARRHHPLIAAASTARTASFAVCDAIVTIDTSLRCKWAMARGSVG